MQIKLLKLTLVYFMIKVKTLFENLYKAIFRPY